MLKAQGISYAVDRKQLLHETSIHFEPEKLHVIMGANGAGKSTLLKLLAGDISTDTGKVILDNIEIDKLPKKELARKRAVLSQHYQLAFPISVTDLVMMGRFPYYSSSHSLNDEEICEKALELMDAGQLKYRAYDTLSGGEAQKVQMSRVLAQIWGANKEDRKLLFLDEPVSHLDVKYQYQLLQTAKELTHQHNTVIAILHDLNLAISFADRIIMMKEGRILFDITDTTLLTENILKDVFDISSKIIHPENHKPVVIF